MVNSFGVEDHGSTPLKEALWWVLGRLSTGPEHRKIVLVVTDGYPDDPESDKVTITEVQWMGMEVLGTGIDTPFISSIIPCAETITDIHKITPTMFRFLQYAMTERRKWP